MKISEFTISPAEIEIAVQKRQQQEFKKLKEHTPRIDGYSIFEICRETGEISKAEFIEGEDYVIGAENRPKLSVKKGCVYVEALNAKNAVKRLKRGDIIYSS